MATGYTGHLQKEEKAVLKRGLLAVGWCIVAKPRGLVQSIAPWALTQKAPDRIPRQGLVSVIDWKLGILYLNGKG